MRLREIPPMSGISIFKAWILDQVEDDKEEPGSRIFFADSKFQDDEERSSLRHLPALFLSFSFRYFFLMRMLCGVASTSSSSPM